jgi:polyvinyl alcohol dehydrogenase (cytochrome)
MQRACVLHFFSGVAAMACIIQSLSAQSLGETVYKMRCAACHEQTNPRIPHRDTLKKMPASRILRSLDFGAMMSVAYPLRRAEREAVAAYLGTAGPDSAPPPTAFCRDRTVTLANTPKSAWNGWSPAATNARFQSGDAAGLTISQVRRLTVKWAFGFEGDVTAFAQPTVLDQQVFVGSAGGIIHALRVETGCLQWIFQANGPVRSSILVVPLGKEHALLFGDQTGWFYALVAETGRLLWKKKVEDHEAARLTGAAVAHNGTVFIPVASWEEARAVNPDYPCCTFRGSVVALRIEDGKQLWKSYTVTDVAKETGKTQRGTPRLGPSGAGIWSAPTLDLKRGLLYVTTGDNYSSPPTPTSDAILAFELATGRIVWSKQTTPGDVFNTSCMTDRENCPKEDGPDYDFGSSAILVARPDGRDLLLAGQKSGIVYALDPERNGEILWQVRVGQGSSIGGVQWGMASDGQRVYAAVSDVGRTRPTDPLDVRRFILDPHAGGGLTALRIVDGSKAWYVAAAPCSAEAASGCSPAQPAAVTAIPGVVFSGSLDGHLRAFSAESGAILWDFDTVRDFHTVNGVKAKGGAMDGPGAVVVNGMVLVNSGYARFGGIPGNVLLAFAPEQP